MSRNAYRRVAIIGLALAVATLVLLAVRRDEPPRIPIIRPSEPRTVAPSLDETRLRVLSVIKSAPAGGDR